VGIKSSVVTISFPDGRLRTFSTLAGLGDPRVREMLRRNPKARASVEIVLGEPMD